MVVKKGVLTEYTGSGGDVVIPNDVTSIGPGAFQKCQNLKSVVIPEGVTSIGKKAFYFCTKLKSVTIPSSVTSIGDDAFNYCWELKSVTVPSNATIGYNAFPENCNVIKGTSVSSASSTRPVSNSTQRTTGNSSVPRASSTLAKSSSSAPRTSSTPRAASSSTPADQVSSTSGSSGNDFLSQVRHNSIENSPENVRRRRAEAETQAQDKERRDIEAAIVIKLVNRAKDEILHYAPYYWHTTENGQRECTGEIVINGTWSYSLSNTHYGKFVIGGEGGVYVGINWYGEPRMDRSEMPKRTFEKLDYWQREAEKARERLVLKAFSPDAELVCTESGIIFKKCSYSIVVNGESIGERIFLRKLREAFGSGVSIMPCSPEMTRGEGWGTDCEGDSYRYKALKMSKKYKFSFVF